MIRANRFALRIALRIARATKFGDISTAARGAERKGRNPAQGSRGFGAPYGPRNSTPRFSNSGSRTPPPSCPLEPRKGAQVERPLTSSTKRHINSPQNNAKLDTPFPMWQFGLHNKCFWRTRRSKIKTIARGGDTPPRHAPKHAPRAGKKGTINFAACMRRKAPKNAEKRRKAPKNAEKRRKPCA